MSNIKICDRCKNVFPERETGSATIQSGIVYLDTGTMNLAGDMCANCTGAFLNRPKMIGGRHFSSEELSDRDKETGEWEPQ